MLNIWKLLRTENSSICERSAYPLNSYHGLYHIHYILVLKDFEWWFYRSFTSDPNADAVSSLTILASNPQVLETRCEEKSSFSLLRLFRTGKTTMTNIFSSTSRKLVIPETFSSLCIMKRKMVSDIVLT